MEKCPYERGFGSLGPGQKAWAEPQELKLMAPFPSHHAEGKVILTLMICFERPGIIYVANLYMALIMCRVLFQMHLKP